jgi:hypothetical protein
MPVAHKCSSFTHSLPVAGTSSSSSCSAAQASAPTHSRTHALTHSRNPSLTDSLTTHPPTHSRTHALTHHSFALTYSLTHSPTHSFTHPLTRSPPTHPTRTRPSTLLYVSLSTGRHKEGAPHVRRPGGCQAHLARDQAAAALQVRLLCVRVGRGWGKAHKTARHDKPNTRCALCATKPQAFFAAVPSATQRNAPSLVHPAPFDAAAHPSTPAVAPQTHQQPKPEPKPSLPLRWLLPLHEAQRYSATSTSTLPPPPPPPPQLLTVPRFCVYCAFFHFRCWSLAAPRPPAPPFSVQSLRFCCVVSVSADAGIAAAAAARRHHGGHQNIVALRDVVCGSRASRRFEDCYIVLDQYECVVGCCCVLFALCSLLMGWHACCVVGCI